MTNHTNTDPGNDSIELLCNRCGKTFSTFLHQMADQNAKVVCPDCAANPDCNSPRTASLPSHPVN
jgi:formylmethanofuran dehydrogenase subunit E